MTHNFLDFFLTPDVTALDRFADVPQDSWSSLQATRRTLFVLLPGAPNTARSTTKLPLAAKEKSRNDALLKDVSCYHCFLLISLHMNHRAQILPLHVRKALEDPRGGLFPVTMFLRV